MLLPPLGFIACRINLSYMRTHFQFSFFFNSMGCMITRHFLLYHVSAEWIAKYVHHFIAMGPPFAGAQSALMGASTQLHCPFRVPLI
jgi:hypothetical protein